MIITECNLTKIIDDELQLAQLKKAIGGFLAKYGIHRFKIAMSNADKKNCALNLYYDGYSSSWELSRHAIPFCSHSFDQDKLTNCFYFDGLYYWYLAKNNHILCLKA